MSIISFITSIAGIVSIPLAIYFYFKPRPIKKRILYGFRSIGLLQNPPDFADLQITYKGQEIKSLYITRVVLWNAGDDMIKRKDDIYPGDQLRIVFEKPDLSIESKLLYVSSGAENIRPSLYPKNDGSLPEGILIEFDFLDPRQGLALQIMHQNPQQEFVIQGKMTNSHRNKISELRMGEEDFKGNSINSTIGAFRTPFILFFGMILMITFGSISMFFLGYLSSFLGFISAEDFALIMNGSYPDALNQKRDILVAASMVTTLFFSAFLLSKISDFFARKTQDIVKASLNIESELLEVFQDSTWTLSGQDILR